MSTVMVRDDIADGAWLGHGAIGGLLGGLVLLGVESALAVAAFGAGAAVLPLRMAAGILLGPGAVEADSPLVPVAVAGAVVHVTLAGMFGLLFASIMEGRARRRTTLAMLLAGLAYGAGLWAVNFYGIAPLFGWDWFPRRTSAIPQLLAHAVAYAPVVALYLQRVDARQREVVIETAERAVIRRRAA
jgi:hypothetical protein